tara:strand:+ start:216 stop:1481 length:1266 start_codon:yes stop_codon:yes gene_type:complete
LLNAANARDEVPDTLKPVFGYKGYRPFPAVLRRFPGGDYLLANRQSSDPFNAAQSLLHGVLGLANAFGGVMEETDIQDIIMRKQELKQIRSLQGARLGEKLKELGIAYEPGEERKALQNAVAMNKAQFRMAGLYKAGRYGSTDWQNTLLDTLAAFPERGGFGYQVINDMFQLRKGESAWQSQRAKEGLYTALGTAALGRSIFSLVDSVRDLGALEVEKEQDGALPPKTAWRLRNLRGKGTMGLMPEDVGLGPLLGYSLARTAMGGLPKYYDLEKAVDAAEKRAENIARAAADGFAFEIKRQLAIAEDRMPDRKDLVRQNRPVVSAWSKYLDAVYPRLRKKQRRVATVTEDMLDMRQAALDAVAGKPRLRALLAALELEAKGQTVAALRSSLEESMLDDWIPAVEEMHKANSNPLVEPPKEP